METTMNKENVQLVIDAIKAGKVRDVPIGFLMSNYITFDGDIISWDDDDRAIKHDCGTAACIGGYCGLLMGQSVDETRNNSIRPYREWLGISEEEVYLLFFAHGCATPFEKITAEQAVKVLEHLRDTGVVYWGAADA
jgi:hypothetical protein